MYIKPCPEKIRAARRKQGLSAYALAMKAGLDKKAIYRIESKESLDLLRLLARAVRFSLHLPPATWNVAVQQRQRAGRAGVWQPSGLQ